MAVVCCWVVALIFLAASYILTTVLADRQPPEWLLAGLGSLESGLKVLAVLVWIVAAAAVTVFVTVLVRHLRKRKER